jgi:hypothetical protein
MKNVKGAIKYILLLIIAGILLYYSFREVHFKDFVSGLRSCNYWWITLSMLVGAISVLIRSERWRLIMIPLNKGAEGKGRVKSLHAWDALNIAYLTNFAIPRAGEITRCGVISRKSGLSFEKVVGTVVLERSFDMLCLLIVTFSLFFISWDTFGYFIRNEIIIPAGRLLGFGTGSADNGAGFINMLIILGLLTAAFLIFAFIIYKYRHRNALFRKISDILTGLIAGLASGVKMPQKWLFFLYTILLWVSYWLMSWTTILSFPSVSGLGPADALFLMVVGSFGWVVPVQGGIGAYHFIVSLALTSVYSITQTTGIVFATISHESQAVQMLILGVVSMISVSRKN